MYGLVILCICQLLVISSAQCPGGQTTADQCVQKCGSTECRCNASRTNTSSYSNCVQSCEPPDCDGDGKMTCNADGNCTQTCKPGDCDMDCDALQYCTQHGDDNGLERMKCSAKKCVQTCQKGECKHMRCEGENCHQTCSRGGCIMNCTQSVDYCVQRCTAHADCTLDCRAKTCVQSCVGPKNCNILNSGRVYRVNGNFLAFLLVFVFINLKCGWI